MFRTSKYKRGGLSSHTTKKKRQQKRKKTSIKRNAENELAEPSLGTEYRKVSRIDVCYWLFFYITYMCIYIKRWLYKPKVYTR